MHDFSMQMSRKGPKYAFHRMVWLLGTPLLCGINFKNKIKMKKIYTLSTFLLVMQLAAQNQVNYKITRTAPELSEISNIYVAPKFILDIPFYQQRMEDPTDAMLLYTIGLGITTHAIVREKFFVDINMNTAYTLLGGGRFRDLNLGGAYLLNTKTRNKMLKVVLESKEVSREKIAFERNYGC
jgi:hypothetical protein